MVFSRLARVRCVSAAGKTKGIIMKLWYRGALGTAMAGGLAFALTATVGGLSNVGIASGEPAPKSVSGASVGQQISPVGNVSAATGRVVDLGAASRMTPRPANASKIGTLLLDGTESGVVAAAPSAKAAGSGPAFPGPKAVSTVLQMFPGTSNANSSCNCHH